MKIVVLAFTFTSLALGIPAGAATITGGIDAPAGAVGLAGTFTHVGTNETQAFDINTTLAALSANPVTGKFTATTLNYRGVDDSSIKDFLGSTDGASYVGPSAADDLADGVLELKGYIDIASPETITFGIAHDDATQLKVGEQTLVSRGCCGYNQAVATFTHSGLYAVDVIYSNTNYGGRGQAYFGLNEDGVSTTNLVQAAVPEPATWALMLVGFGTAGAAMRGSRRKAASVA